MDATLKVAKLFPKVHFEHASGFKTAANMATYEARFYEGSYLLVCLPAARRRPGPSASWAPFPFPRSFAHQRLDFGRPQCQSECQSEGESGSIHGTTPARSAKPLKRSSPRVRMY